MLKRLFKTSAFVVSILLGIVLLVYLSRTHFLTQFNIYQGIPGFSPVEFTIDQKGNVGIGTTSPQATLEVAGTIRSTTLWTDSSKLGLVQSGVWQGSEISEQYLADNLTVFNGNINQTPIGMQSPSSGSFTTLTAYTLDTILLQTSNLTITNQLLLPGNSVTDAMVVDTITAARYLPLIGGTMSGSINLGGNNLSNATTISAFQFFGLLTGNVVGNVTGNLTGNVAGNVIGNITGDVTGNMVGDVTGNVTGNLTGNVTGDITSYGISSFNYLTSGEFEATGSATIAQNLTVAGNVGIGTTSPVYQLDVLGTGRFTGDLRLTGAFYDSLINPGATGYYLQSTGTGTAWTQLSSGNQLLPTGTEGQTLYNNSGLWTANSGLFYDDVNARVGIGTIAPAYKLDVAGTGNFYDLISNNLTLSGLSTNILSAYKGFDGYTNFSGGIGTGGIGKDSITNAERLTSAGNLVNIGSIQGGQTLLTKGGTFAGKVDYTTTTYPDSVAIGDLNGDGKADLAVANWSSASISVFLNNSNGTFATKVDYATGSTPFSVAIGDLNGDGKADLAVSNNGSNSVSVLLNNGNGTFATKVDYATANYPRFAAIGDLNGDGKADLVVPCDSNSVSVLLNNGNGTFAIKVDYVGSYPNSAAIGDFNGDGNADFVTGNWDGSASVFINNGNGTFATKVDYTTGSSGAFVAVGDLNGDGKADFATANYGSNSVSVFFNNGDGAFASKVDYTTGAGPDSVAIGDLNGDGKADLAVANRNSNSVSVFLNNGDGTFAGKVDYTAGTKPYSVAIGDLNGDGKADLTTVNFNSATVSVFLNQPYPMFYAQASSGYVGIGTTGPSGGKLHVYQASGIFPDGNAIKMEGGTDINVGFSLSSNGKQWQFSKRSSADNDAFAFWYHDGSNWNERMRLLTGGEVVLAADTDTYWSHPAANTLAWTTNGTERVRINSSGNVGIGTTSPGAELEVNTRAAATKGLIIKGMSSQSAYLQEIQDSSATVLSGFNSLGYVQSNGAFSTTNFFAGYNVVSNAVFSHTTGNEGWFNLGIGSYTLNSLTTGYSNVALGFQAGYNVTSGNSNTLIGFAAGVDLVNGTGNVALGYSALGNAISGEANLAMGQFALFTLTAASNDIGIGPQAGYLTTGASNTYIGAYAGRNQSTGAVNVMLGGYAGYGNASYNSGSNVIIGYEAAKELGTATGENVVLGKQAGFKLGASNYNTLIGSRAGYTNVGDRNVFIGKDAGYRQTTTSNTLLIDNQIRADAATELTNALIYGVMAATPTSQKLVINGNVGIGTTGPGALLDISSGDVVGLKVGADLGGITRTDATRKFFRMGAAHYTNTEEPASLIVLDSSSGYNYMYLGGGNNSLNAVTRLSFYAAADGTTVSGTEIARVTTTGLSMQNGNLNLNGHWLSGDGGNEGLSVDSSGNVGIGTTAPSYKLDVSGTARFTGDLRLTGAFYDTSASAGATGYYLQSTGTGTGWTQLSAGNQLLPTGTEGQTLYNNAGNWTANNGLFYDDVNSRVGIGTTGPVAKLEVRGDNTTNITVSSTANNTVLTNLGLGNVDDSTTPFLSVGDSTTGWGWFYRNSDGDFSLLRKVNSSSYTTTPVLYMDRSSGFVGIGTSSPSLPFSVEGSARFTTDPAVYYGGIVTMTTKSGLYSEIGSLKNGAATNPSMYFGRNYGVDSGRGDRIYSPALGEYTSAIVLTEDGNFRYDVTPNRSTSEWQRVETTIGTKLFVGQTGNVGIGTTSPTSKLSLIGGSVISVATSDGADNSYLGISGGGDSSTARGANIYLLGNEYTTGNQNGDLVLWAGNGDAGTNKGDITFNAGSERMRIASGGNVGIGTTSPTNRLQVWDNSATPLTITRVSTATNTSTGTINSVHETTGDMVDGFGVHQSFRIKDATSSLLTIGTVGAVRSGADNTGSLVFSTTNNGTSSENMRIANTGNVGIGTTGPSYKLDVSGTGRFTGDLRLTGALYDTAASVGASGYYLQSTSTGTSWSQLVTGVQTLPTGTEGQTLYNNAGVWTANSSLFYDDVNSRVGIGTTAPAYKLDISGDFKIDKISNSGTGTGTVYCDIDRSVYGTGTLFLSELSVGGTITVQNQTYTIQSIYDDTNLVITDWCNSFYGSSFTYSGGSSPFVYKNGYVGIGTTSPAANLEVNGTSILNGTSIVRGDMTFESAGSKSITGLYTIRSYSYQSLNGDVAWTSGGSGIMKLYNSNGNNFTRLQFGGASSAYPALNSINTVFGGSTSLQVVAADGSSNANLLVTGKIGIGLTNPTDKLDVYGGMKIGASYAGIATTAPANGLLVQGNVGIGTTGPSYPLDVTGNARFTGKIGVGAAPSATYAINALSDSGDGLNVRVNNDSQGGLLNFQGFGLNAILNIRPYTGAGGLSAGMNIEPKTSDKRVSLYVDEGDSQKFKIGVNSGSGITSPGISGAGIVAMTITTTGNVGIGTTGPLGTFDILGKVYVDSDGKMTSSFNKSSTTSYVANYFNEFVTSSTAGLGTVVGFDANMTRGGAGAWTGEAIALRGIATANSAANTTTLWGVLGKAQNTAAGTVTDAVALAVSNGLNNGGGTISKQYGLYVPDLTVGSTNYGIYSNLASGANKWNLYMNGTADNYIAGNVGIGTTVPGASLAVEGTFVGGDLATSTVNGTNSFAWGHNVDITGVGSVISGGYDNTISGHYATIGGGKTNTTSSAAYATVGGGYLNTASGSYAIISGGTNNTASNTMSTIAGGGDNTANGVYTTISGGTNNTANGAYGVVPGGLYNTAAGDYSFAAGKYMQLTSAADNTFVWGHAGSAISIPTPDAFIIYSGNVGIGTTAPGTKLAVAGLTGTASYNLVRVDTATGDFYYDSSSEKYKENIQPFETDFSKILNVTPKLFTDKASQQREIGFIAEEFDAVGLGDLVIYDQNGNPNGLKYDKVPLYLLGVIKEQQKQIEQLQLASASAGNFDAEAILSQTREIEATLNQEIADRQILSSRVDQLAGKLTDLQNEASQSATMATKAFTLSVEGDLVLDKNLMLGKNLDVKGKTTLAELEIGKSLSMGLIMVDGSKASIQTIAGSLKLQADSLGSLEIMGGRISIDQKGNLEIAEGVIAGNTNFRDVIAIPAGVTEVKIQKSQDKNTTGCEMGEAYQGIVVAECVINWETAPAVVNATPSYKTIIWVEDITEEGFTIKVGDASQTEEKLYWMAMW